MTTNKLLLIMEERVRKDMETSAKNAAPTVSQTYSVLGGDTQKNEENYKIRHGVLRKRMHGCNG